jgi:hypothetical protein
LLKFYTCLTHKCQTPFFSAKIAETRRACLEGLNRTLLFDFFHYEKKNFFSPAHINLLGRAKMCRQPNRNVQNVPELMQLFIIFRNSFNPIASIAEWCRCSILRPLPFQGPKKGPPLLMALVMDVARIKIITSRAI